MPRALRIPIDPNPWTFTVSTPPEPVIDFTTKAPKADANGQALWSIELVAFADGGGQERPSAQVISVKFPGPAAPSVKHGIPVKVTGLVASPWERNGKAGISFIAAGIEAPNGSAPKGGGAA